MKKFIITLLTTLLAVNVLATELEKSTHVDQKDVLLVAKNYLRSNGIDTKSVGKITKTEKDSLGALYHIVNFENNGWVIVSGNRNSEPVLAFASNGFFNFDQEKHPVHLLLESYEKGVAKRRGIKNNTYVKMWNDLISGNLDVKKRDWNFLLQSNGREILWRQSYPYNIYSPNGLAGCGPVAVGMVCKYLGFPDAMDYQASSNRRYHKLYDYNLMPPNTEEITEIEKIEVADFLRIIGSKCGTQYVETADEAFSATRLTNLMDGLDKMGLKDAERLERETWLIDDYTDAEWKQKIIDELINKRPVIYYAGDNIFGLHYFVLDEYVENIDKFHINWGHGDNTTPYNSGGENGFYKFDDFDGYDLDQNMIINLKVPTNIAEFKATTTSKMDNGNGLVHQYKRIEITGYDSNPQKWLTAVAFESVKLKNGFKFKAIDKDWIDGDVTFHAKVRK